MNSPFMVCRPVAAQIVVRWQVKNQPAGTECDQSVPVDLPPASEQGCFLQTKEVGMPIANCEPSGLDHQ